MNGEDEAAKARVDLVKIAFKAQDDGDETKQLLVKLLLQPTRPEKED